MCSEGNRGPDTELINRRAAASVREANRHGMHALDGRAFHPSPLRHAGCARLPMLQLLALQPEFSWVWVEIRVHEERQKIGGLEKKGNTGNRSRVPMLVKLYEKWKKTGVGFFLLSEHTHPNPALSRFLLGLPEGFIWGPLEPALAWLGQTGDKTQ